MDEVIQPDTGTERVTTGGNAPYTLLEIISWAVYREVSGTYGEPGEAFLRAEWWLENHPEQWTE